jgi:hypothetical protein
VTCEVIGRGTGGPAADGRRTDTLPGNLTTSFNRLGRAHDASDRVRAVSSSALTLGGVVGAYWRAPERFTEVVLAFASGLIIFTPSFDLFEDAFSLGGAARAGFGLTHGCGG